MNNLILVYTYSLLELSIYRYKKLYIPKSSNYIILYRSNLISILQYIENNIKVINHKEIKNIIDISYINNDTCLILTMDSICTYNFKSNTFIELYNLSSKPIGFCVISNQAFIFFNDTIGLFNLIDKKLTIVPTPKSIKPNRYFDILSFILIY